MSRVYLVNVGANASHSMIARSPIFENGSFVFVHFPHPGNRGMRPYSAEELPFVRRECIDIHDTHWDPDWPNLTYGDNCSQPRSCALLSVVEDDILLFWALLWRNTGSTWASFTRNRCWCLIGALRVHEILEAGQRPEDAKASRRARQNVHFRTGKLDSGHRVFVGCPRYSLRFPKAVDLEIAKASGLLYRTIRTARGAALRLNGKPRWNSSLRSCRVIWDLANSESRGRAEIARDAILCQTGYDVLGGL